ncbi:hypothetical protein MHBO_004832 [Bonamia ostreae]|uniref:Uncharacterized protein n=1 Tax=Bonamia ostreae TaxID=126728 RepID=A0ABV2AUD1_9EUKA
MKVVVNANSDEEAEQLAKDAWDNGDIYFDENNCDIGSIEDNNLSYCAIEGTPILFTDFDIRDND